jgi:rhodanese-related sulfurtransferase/glyoxylase-like metal-dependent hydrolase (beta-lactamase superfamily II)
VAPDGTAAAPVEPAAAPLPSGLDLVAETAETSEDFVFRQYRLGPLAQYSYLVGSRGEALVVDPARESEPYLAVCRELGLSLRYVALTHAHADFVAGHTELRHAVAGVELVMSEAAGARFTHRAVRHGEEVRIGVVKAVVLATPGHALDAITLAIHVPADSLEPRLVLTGDALLAGAVGRPEFLDEALPPAVLAAMGFRAWSDRLAPLPDAVRVYPGHGGGGFFQGRPLDVRPFTTIGQERAANPFLQHRDPSAYVTAVLDGLAEPPSYFRHAARINLDGPPLVIRREPLPPELSPAEAEVLARKDVWLADVREPQAFAAGHARGSLNLPLDSRFEARVGAMLPWGEPFILIGSDAEVAEARHRLHRIGFDVPTGYVVGGLEAWIQAGLPVQPLPAIAAADLERGAWGGLIRPLLLDVRTAGERTGPPRSDALAMPLAELGLARRRLDPNMPVLLLAASFQDASMAGSLLQHQGFADVRALAGPAPAGPAAARSMGEAPAPAPSLIPAASSGPTEPAIHEVAAGPEGWPDPMTPEDLARRLLDWPGSVELVDIRPAWQFDEYHLPNSVNMPPAQVLAASWPATETRPLVLICRDGYLSAAAAGALARRTSRPVRYLVGGARRYYDEVARPRANRPVTR